MSLSSIRTALALLIASVALAACGEPNGPQLPVEVINIGGFDGGDACIQPSFPADQPDLFVLAVPRFLLTTVQAQQTTSGQALVRPGEVIEGEIPVNGATRQVRMEIEDVWTPGSIIYAEEFSTGGNTIIDFAFVPAVPNRGRYYMKLTLCGFDCNEREVIFTVLECETSTADSPLCAHNAPYQRTVIELGEVVQEDSTCIDLGGTPGVGSGTVLIQ